MPEENGNRTIHEWMRHIDGKLEVMHQADEAANRRLEDKIDQKAASVAFQAHESQDEKRFSSMDRKLDDLTKKVYMLLGGLALLQVLVGWYLGK